MKSILYICLAIVSMLLVVSLLTSNGLNRTLAAQTNSTAYWKGRYDSVELKADTFAHLVIELSCTKDSAIMDEGYMHKDWTRDVFTHLSMSLKWANSLRTSSRHSRHRKDSSKHYIRSIRIDSDMINDQKGANGMLRNNYDTSIHR